VIELPKHDRRTAEGQREYVSGTWFPVTIDGMRSARIVCPECGRACSIGSYSPGSESGHIIAADGRVTPSLVCPSEGCGWHVFVRLRDWEAA